MQAESWSDYPYESSNAARECSFSGFPPKKSVHIWHITIKCWSHFAGFSLLQGHSHTHKCGVVLLPFTNFGLFPVLSCCTWRSGKSSMMVPGIHPTYVAIRMGQLNLVLWSTDAGVNCLSDCTHSVATQRASRLWQHLEDLYSKMQFPIFICLSVEQCLAIKGRGSEAICRVAIFRLFYKSKQNLTAVCIYDCAITFCC